jgi:hypothetical protein
MKGFLGAASAGVGVGFILFLTDPPTVEKHRLFGTGFHRLQHATGWWSGKPASQVTVVITDHYVDGHPTRLTLSGIVCSECGFLHSTTSKHDSVDFPRPDGKMTISDRPLWTTTGHLTESLSYDARNAQIVDRHLEVVSMDNQTVLRKK